MKNPFAPKSLESFFWENGGYGYSQNQTPEEGRKACAITLADAARKAFDNNYSFEWEQDDITNQDFEDSEGGPYYLWCCICRDDTGKVLASLCGIDFGRDKSPWGEPYRRVVEAELALEAI